MRKLDQNVWTLLRRQRPGLIIWQVFNYIYSSYVSCNKAHYVTINFYTICQNLKIAEKKKKQKKEGRSENSGPTLLEEETEEGYRHAVWVMTMKLFADMERRRSITLFL